MPNAAWLHRGHENRPVFEDCPRSVQPLLAQGIERFGVRVVAEKRDHVYAMVEHILAAFPAIKRPHPNLGLCVYAIARTPFIVLYDFDDVELRVHFIFHRHADLRDLDPRAVEW